MTNAVDLMLYEYGMNPRSGRAIESGIAQLYPIDQLEEMLFPLHGKWMIEQSWAFLSLGVIRNDGGAFNLYVAFFDELSRRSSGSSPVVA